jgi:hypothetical protein
MLSIYIAMPMNKKGMQKGVAFYDSHAIINTFFKTTGKLLLSRQYYGQGLRYMRQEADVRQ